MKILIADDHSVVREGLKQMLNKLQDVQQIDETDNGINALNKIESSEYDFVILDISLPGMSGLDVLKNLKLENKQTCILILSMHPEEQYAVRALKLGASGYITKDRAGEELIAAIKKISSGGKYVSPELGEYLAFHMDKNFEKLTHENLSEREYQIMLMLAEGKSVKEIAKVLFLSEKTISTHRSRIMEKMGMKKNADLTFYAMKNKLIE